MTPEQAEKAKATRDAKADARKQREHDRELVRAALMRIVADENAAAADVLKAAEMLKNSFYM